MRAGPRDVRFTPESGHTALNSMSALCQKRTLGEIYSISSSARSVEGTLLSKTRLILRQRCSREEAIMVDASKLKMDKIEHPAAFYTTPDDVVKDNDLSAEEKKKALNSWEQ